MNRFFTLLLAASCLTAVAQVEIAYPYNPDNGDGLIGSPDLLELLTLYGIDFQPEPPVVNDMPIQEWMDSIQSIVLVQQAFIDSVQDESGTTDLDACDNMESINYHGYDYELVAIGEQCWFAENLRTTHYTNGDEISNSIYSWIGSQSGLGEYQDQGSTGVFGEMVDSVASVCETAPTIGFCEGGGTNLVVDPCEPTQSVSGYGRMYNGFAISDQRGVCPVDWHVSTDSDWLELEIFSGMLPATSLETGQRGEQAMFLKLSDGWGNFVDGINTFNFNALPGGYRSLYAGSVGWYCENSGPFFERRIWDYDAGSQGSWWSPHGNSYVSREMSAGSLSIGRSLQNEHNGLYVRCVKDSE